MLLLLGIFPLGRVQSTLGVFIDCFTRPINSVSQRVLDQLVFKSRVGRGATSRRAAIVRRYLPGAVSTSSVLLVYLEIARPECIGELFKVRIVTAQVQVGEQAHHVLRVRQEENLRRVALRAHLEAF